MQVRKKLKKPTSSYRVSRSDFDIFIDGVNWQMEQSHNCTETLIDLVSMKLESIESPRDRQAFIINMRHWLQNTGWLGWLKETGQAAAFLELLSDESSQ